MSIKEIKEQIFDYFTDRYKECTVRELKEFSQLLDKLITEAKSEQIDADNWSHAAHRLG